MKESNWLKPSLRILDQAQKFTPKLGPVMLQPPMSTTLLREKGIALKVPKILKPPKVQLETKGNTTPAQELDHKGQNFRKRGGSISSTGASNRSRVKLYNPAPKNPTYW